MTRSTTVARPCWCPACCRSIPVTASMLIERPADPAGARRWDDAARREIAAAFERDHVPACVERAMETVQVRAAARGDERTDGVR